MYHVSVMVGGPAVVKAGDYLDWIAGGLEWKNSKILVTPVRFRQGPHIFDNFFLVWIGKTFGPALSVIRHPLTSYMYHVSCIMYHVCLLSIHDTWYMIHCLDAFSSMEIKASRLNWTKLNKLLDFRPMHRISNCFSSVSQETDWNLASRWFVAKIWKLITNCNFWEKGLVS